jgi:hypothetical protein
MWPIRGAHRGAKGDSPPSELGTVISTRHYLVPEANWSDPMKTRPKRSDERSRCGHGIVTDSRGQDQPADGSRARQVLTAHEPLEPRRQQNIEFSTPPGRGKQRHRERPTSTGKSS